jgi:predicted AAA+ superfamily ATPase
MPDGFVDAAFRLGPQLRAEPSPLRRRDYLSRARRGGYPEALLRSGRRRERFFADYVSEMIVRDVHQVADIQRTADMRRLLSLLAEQTSCLLNMRRLASAIGVTAPTVRSWIAILETIYLVRLMPAWSGSLTARAVSAPKVMFLDTGLAGHLGAGADAETAGGRLIENFVVGELARQLSWIDFSARLYHYRDRDQYEVDAVLEDNAGVVVGVEVKSSETVRATDFRGLRVLQRRLGERFRAGFVLYSGEESLSFGDGMVAVPISALWTTPPVTAR